MQRNGVFIDRRRCLRAPIPIAAVEVSSRNAVRAERTLERRIAVHRFGCVISHIFYPSLFYPQTSWALAAHPSGIQFM
jgi:hypothetical protein